MIYGCYGYTGTIVAREAVRRGLKPLLAGRHAGKVAKLANELGLERRTIALDQAQAIDEALQQVPLVLNCAGPYAFTAAPMVQACLRTSTHYMDVTGEIDVFEAMAAQDAEARQAGMMLLPGMGFDVVPGDCLGVHLKERLPSATRLAIGFQARTFPSRGTAKSSLVKGVRGGMIRQDGALKQVPAGWKVRRIDFGRGVKTIPNIECYMAMPQIVRMLLVASRAVGWILGASAVRRALYWLIDRFPPGPNAEQRARGYSLMWSEVEDDAGEQRSSRLACPEGYALTIETALTGVKHVLAGDAPAGFQTPAKAYGADFILEIEGVSREES
jgi:short subunit dehydrogenase-like uncharacterized protein